MNGVGQRKHIVSALIVSVLVVSGLSACGTQKQYGCEKVTITSDNEPMGGIYSAEITVEYSSNDSVVEPAKFIYDIRNQAGERMHHQNPIDANPHSISLFGRGPFTVRVIVVSPSGDEDTCDKQIVTLM